MLKFKIGGGILLPLFLSLVAVLQSAAMTVYYDNTASGWGEVYCYAWKENPKQENAKWHGVSMTRIDGTNYWEYEVPEGLDNVIFNNGSAQTADLVAYEDMVYTKDGPTGKDAYEYGILTGPAKPFNVYFDNYESTWGTVCCKVKLKDQEVGSGAGETMELYNGSIYKLTVPADCEALIFNDGGTVILSQVAAVANMVYTMSGSTNTKISEWSTPVRGDVYVYLHGDWSNPKAYVYTEKGGKTIYNEGFPGVAMEKDEATGYWRYKLPEEFKAKSRVIISADNNRYPEDGQPGMLLERKSMILVASTHDWLDYETYRPIDPNRESPLGKYESHEDKDGTVVVTGTAGTLYVTPWAPEIVRIFTLGNNATAKEPRKSISVVDKDDETLVYDFPEMSYKVSDDDDFVYIDIYDESEKRLEVHVSKDKLLVTFYENDKLLLAESQGLVNSPGGNSSRVSFAGNGGNEAFYGGGYNGNYTNLDGKSMVMNNTQQGGWEQGAGGPNNICIPYYVSTRGYGVFFDSHYRGAKISPSKDGSSYTSSSTDPIAYYFCGGGTMEKAMQNYNLLTGHQPLPPYWTLGYISSKFSFISDNEARNVAVNTRNVNVPIDGIVLDIAWQGGSKGTSGTYGMGFLDWDPDNYPNKGQMVKDLLKDNVHTVAICEPFFNSAGNASANYNYLKNQGWLADTKVTANGNMNWISGGADVGLIDASNPEAMTWFADQLVPHSIDGMSGWWLDLGEPEAYNENFEGNTRHKGGSPSQVHNEFGNLWTGAIYKRLATSTEKTVTADGEEIELREMRHMTLPRAGTAGMQRYGAMPWTGDIKRSWGGLAAQVPALVSAAMSGVSFLGSDIGGFTATYGMDQDLYRRWVQLGVFYPMMRTHSATEPEVWKYDRVLDDVRNAINLRYAYLPYTYTQAYMQTAYGTPIARPIGFDDAEDPMKTANCIDEYLWGPDLLVAPVLSYNDTRDIVFPSGDWLDMNDFKTIHAGNSRYTANVPKSQLPHFMRRGSLVTRYKQDTYTNTVSIESDKLYVDYFPTYDDTPTYGYFYDDDKKGVDNVRAGKYQLMHFVGQASGPDGRNALAIGVGRFGDGWEGMPATQDVTFRIRDFKIKPASSSDETLTAGEVSIIRGHITPNDADIVPRKAAGPDYWTKEEVQKYNSLDELEKGDKAGYYHQDGTFYLRMPQMRTDRKYVMNFGKEYVHTGVEELVDMTAMTLSYGGGLFTYMLPEGTEDAKLEVYSVTGAKVASVSGLKTTGYAEQAGVELADGVYVGVLSGKGSNGVVKSKTVKMVVK